MYMSNLNAGFKSEGLSCGVKSVVLDVKLNHGLLLNPYRPFRIKKCKGFIDHLAACQCSENDLRICLLQKIKFRPKFYFL